MPAAMVFVGTGTLSGAWWASVALAAVWLILCKFMCQIDVGKEECVVIERFGKLRFLFHGRYTLIIGVDHIQERISLGPRPREELFPDTAPAVKFLPDDSAPVEAGLYYQIGNPRDVAAGNWDRVEKDVRKWFYSNKWLISRIVTDRLLQILEKMSIAEASTERKHIASEVEDAVIPNLKEFGIYEQTGKKFLKIEPIFRNISRR
ncbi:MAG: hypothetical protein WCW36_02215 [Candidatus Paceibacterota bacterium]